MSIAIIIGAHGLVAEQLLKTSEMILGKQKNVAYSNLMPDENTDIMIKKYQKNISDLNIKSGILFLVDTWGGTPFNAANHIAIKNNNNDIITGVNIPMLIEIFMTREDNISYQKLIEIAIENGRSSIKRLKIENKKNITKNEYTNIQTIKKTILTNKFMKISLARIDDRLIHGQVVTNWIKDTKISRIIVINDEIAEDKVRKTLLTQVTPPGITAHVINISKAIRVYNNPKYSQDRVMLLFTNPKDVLRIIELGIPISTINIGGMAFKQGKIQISNAISVDDDDIAAFNKLNEYGIKLEVRKVPSDSPVKIIELIKKIKK